MKTKFIGVFILLLLVPGVWAQQKPSLPEPDRVHLATEYRIAELAAKDYRPGKKFLALKDYISFAEAAEKIRNRNLRQLSTLQLDEYQREAFYPFGAGEALLLDRANPKWQNRYFVDKFDVSRYFKQEQRTAKVANANQLIKSVRLSTGLKLEYVEQGDESGVPVILLHGYSDSWRSYELVLPHLPKSIHAFALSQRGHGNSGHPQSGYHPRDFAKDVVEFMDALKLKQAVIVGHSMGSYVAQRFALDYPERIRGLVLAASFSTLRGHSGVKELWDSTIAKLTDPVDPAFVRGFQQSTLHKAVPSSFFETAVYESCKVPARVWHSALSGLMETDFSSELGKIKTPTLIVWGDRDSLFPRSDQEFLASAIAGSKLLVYTDIGHGLHWEDPERFAADLLSFIQKHVR